MFNKKYRTEAGSRVSFGRRVPRFNFARMREEVAALNKIRVLARTEIHEKINEKQAQSRLESKLQNRAENIEFPALDLPAFDATPVTTPETGAAIKFSRNTKFIKINRA